MTVASLRGWQLPGWPLRGWQRRGSIAPELALDPARDLERESVRMTSAGDLDTDR